MPLSWNEIKTRAATFTNEWKDEVSEDAEAKSFWDDFFNVFGISRRRVATFEQQVKLSSPSPLERDGGRPTNRSGFIDLLWKGVILIEHKSRGKDLNKAYQQAKDYFPGLKEKELPRYILVSDFEKFNLYDLEENTSHQFALAEFVNNVHHFGFIAGYQKRVYKEQDPVNLEAAALMGKLHDKLETIGYTGHALELYLVRLLFCLFADDTNIFEKGILHDYIDLRTSEDGSDLANHIAQLFEILNKPKNERLKNIDEGLDVFPYVNGKLFEEHLPTAGFDSEMRRILLDCCLLDWGKISPAIFGSMFQSVMNPAERRTLGAHYTSEKNILKLIKPLFLDELYKEFETVQDSKAKLQKFHDKIAALRFLDPACGCGNFLIIAYREMRLLEIEIIKKLLKLQGYREEVLREARMDIRALVKCDVDRFYGIEYEEFPAQVARVAMWLIDHQMNEKVTDTFGEYMVRIPLRKSATIVQGNALRIDWQSLIEPIPWEKEEPKYDYIFGNPPFIGHQWRNESQMKDMYDVFGDAKRAGRLDYVAAWYLLGAKYVQLKDTKVAFVSTNSISQGEQVGILWNELFNKYKIKIHFAHRTFKWSNEARSNAAVHVVIIGFANYDIADKRIFEYENIKSEPHERIVKNINPYLAEGKDIYIGSRIEKIHSFPEMTKGSQPTDGLNLILTEDERLELETKEPDSKKWIYQFIGGEELMNNKKRYCLWLKECNPMELKKLPEVLKRVDAVRKWRLTSKTKSVREFSIFPTLFTQDRQPHKKYLALPRVSSENRRYIPIAFLESDIIAHEKLIIIPNADIYLFGILSSDMHMAWVKYVSGRLKSDFSYSPAVYNNFPFAKSVTEKQIKTVEVAAQNVLDIRLKFPESSLADLYDPNTMPPELVKAHNALDKAVDLCYRSQPFPNETKRIEYLFELYDKYTSGLFVKEKKGKNKVV